MATFLIVSSMITITKDTSMMHIQPLDLQYVVKIIRFSIQWLVLCGNLS